jgi:transposase
VAGAALACTQKKAATEGRTIVWIDEAAFYLLPAAVRTYAPRGQTPLLRVPLRYDHLSAISAMTSAGQLLMQMQERAFNGGDVVRFLHHVLRHLPGKLLVIWDGAPIHRGAAIQRFLADGGAARILLEQLPGYAPDLNPDDGIWQYLKQVELKNICCHDLAELRYELRLATARLRHKPAVIKACIAHCGLQL